MSDDLLGDLAPPSAGITRLIECVDRERSQRARVYPRLVSQQKMTPKLAKQETELMDLVRSALSDLAELRLLLLGEHPLCKSASLAAPTERIQELLDRWSA